MPASADRRRARWLAARGLWWRRRLSAAVFAVAAVTMGAAALGPLYARAAGESTLRDTLNQAGSQAGLRLQDIPFGFEFTTGVTQFDRAAAHALRPGAVRGYPQRIGSMYTVTTAYAPDVTGVHTPLVVHTALLWRDGACAHVIIDSGRCPNGAGQALVSQRTVTGGYNWRVGGSVSTGVGVSLRIVGTYTPRDPRDPYWFGQGYFDAAPSVNDEDTVDAVMVDRAEFAAVPQSTEAYLAWDYPLDARAIRLTDVPRLRRDVAALARRFGKATDYVDVGQSLPVNLSLSTDLPAVLNAAAHQRNLVDTGTLLVTLQLGLLAWLVLFHVMTDALEARGSEIALAKLRGLPPGRTLRFALSETVLLLLAAMPAGLGLAWVAARLFSVTVLAPGTPVALTWYTIAALAAGFAGAMVAAAAGSYRVLTRSVLAQWRRTGARVHPSRAALVLDVVLSVAALAGLVVLRLTHKASSANDNAALLAPGLLVVAVALLGTRLLPLLCGVLVRPTRASKRIGLFLAVRQVARRPAGLRLAALLAVAVGLATFAVGGESVAAVNRTARARAELGADRVVRMQYQRGRDPLAAVQRADPDGRWATVTATWLPDGGDSVIGTVLAVDATRLARVGYIAAGGPSLANLAATIAASSVPTITTTAPALRVLITASGMRGPPPQVQFLFRTSATPFLSVFAGQLQPGTHAYTARLPCSAGCTLLGLVWNRSVNFFSGTMSGTVLVRRIDELRAGHWTALDAALTRRGGWRAGPDVSQSSDAVTPTAEGVVDRYRSASGYGGITYASVPQPLPVVSTQSAVTRGPLAPIPARMVDAVGGSAAFVVRTWAPVLPLVLSYGLIADIASLRILLPAFDREADWSIWLGPNAPADAISRLRDAGLTLQASHTVHARVVQLGRQGPQLSLYLLLACAIIGSVVAVGGTAVAIGASARRRSFETAAMRAIGVPRAALYRGGVTEQLLLLGCAVVLGVPAGALTARLAMPVIPEFADATPIQLHYLPPVLPLVGFAVAFAALVVLAALVTSYGVLRAARPTRLREAEE